MYQKILKYLKGLAIRSLIVTLNILAGLVIAAFGLAVILLELPAYIFLDASPMDYLSNKIEDIFFTNRLELDNDKS